MPFPFALWIWWNVMWGAAEWPPRDTQDDQKRL